MCTGARKVMDCSDQKQILLSVLVWVEEKW